MTVTEPSPGRFGTSGRALFLGSPGQRALFDVVALRSAQRSRRHAQRDRKYAKPDQAGHQAIVANDAGSAKLLPCFTRVSCGETQLFPPGGVLSRQRGLFLGVNALALKAAVRRASRRNL